MLGLVGLVRFFHAVMGKKGCWLVWLIKLVEMVENDW